MKVVDQLVSVLDSRGKLSREQRRRLEQLGLVKAAGMPVVDEPVVTNVPVVTREPVPGARRKPVPVVTMDWYDAQEALIPRKRTRQRFEPFDKNGRLLGTEALCQELASEIQNWDEALGGLVRLAGHLGPTPDWQHAVRMICGARSAAIETALERAFGGRTSDPVRLLEAIECSENLELLARTRSPAANAYRALVTAPVGSQLGRYAALLREPLVRILRQLAIARRRIQQAWDSSPIPSGDPAASGKPLDARLGGSRTSGAADGFQGERLEMALVWPSEALFLDLWAATRRW